jgi:iron complex outermembrane receptor protein
MKNKISFRKLISFWLFSLIIQPLFSQQKVDSTVENKTFQEIIVLGKRPEKFAAGSRITTIDSTTLQRFNTGNLSELLEFSLPVYLKSYGPGMLSSIAFRGTSASHTAVLWNGFNIIQPSNGQTDFALVPIFSSDAIEIQHGNASTNYGSGAIGGTVLLSSPIKFNIGHSAGLQQSLGSFNQYVSHLQTNFSNHNLSFQTKLFYQQARNDFSFHNVTRFGSPTEKQQNAALQQYGFTQDVALYLNPNNLLSIRGWYNYSDRQVPPAMGSLPVEARQTDDNLRLSTEWNRFSSAGNTSVRIAFFNEKLTYSEKKLSSQTNIQTFQSQADHEYTYKDKIIVKAGVELQQFNAQVDGYGERKTENRASTFLLTRIQPHPRLHINLNLRQAFIEGYNPPFTPAAGVLFTLLNRSGHTVSLKSNAAKSYRVPTLNERFWLTGGNPLIMPEKSWSYESGIVHKWLIKKVHVQSELTCFYMKVNDWIQWQPTYQGFWSPMNVMQVNPRGLEFSSQMGFSNNLINGTFGVAYTYNASTVSRSYGLTAQETDKQLMYVPLHNSIIFGNVQYKGFMAGANLSYTGYRYTNNSNSDWLDSYLLVNLLAGKSISWQSTTLHFMGRINNLLNQSYQNMENRPMPGRNLQLSIRADFKILHNKFNKR